MARNWTIDRELPLSDHHSASEYCASAAVSLAGPDRPGIVIALHGLTGTRTQPLRYLEGFDSPQFGVLAPDLRGHGATRFLGEAADFTPAQLARDVTALVRKLGLQSRPVAVLGVSLGATVALELVRQGVLNTVAAVFIRPSHGATAAAHLRVNAMIAALLREDPGTALERLEATEEYRHIESVSASAAQGLRDKVTTPRSVERAMRLTEGSRWTAFAPDEVILTPPPTLVVAAERDPLHPVAVARLWHARLAGSTLATLPARDADPTFHLRLARATVQDFLHSVPPRKPRSS